MIDCDIAFDTSALLCVGFGPEVDSREKNVRRIIAVAQTAGIPILLLDSVQQELNRKFREIEQVVPLLRAAFQELSASQSPISVLDFEKIVTSVKATAPPRISRLFEAFERSSVELIRSNPEAKAGQIVPNILWGAVAIENSVRANILSLGLTEQAVDLSSIPDPNLPGLGVGDRTNLRACHALTLVKRRRVLFVALDSPLHARKQEIASIYPLVDVTTPDYIEDYIT